MACCVIQNRWTNFFAGVCSFFLIFAGVYNYFFAVRIVDFDYKRDSADLIETVKTDWYWLIEGSSFDLEHMMQTHSPTKEAQYYGKLFINVLRDHGKFAGFVTYYQRSTYEGVIQFVSVNQHFRGKHYGKILTNHALERLFDMGMVRVTLTTRVSNIWARRVYTSMGFKETRIDDGFVDYAIEKKDLRK